MAQRLLIVDDDHAFRLSTAALLRGEGYEVDVAGDAADAVNRLRASHFDLMLLDLRMPGMDGITLVEALRLWGEPIPVLMISGAGTIDSAVHALHVGADDFLTEPVEPEALFARVGEVLGRRPDLTSADLSNHGLVGRSPRLRAVVESIARVGPTDATVLILGETGTGKELVARAVHHQFECWALRRPFRARQLRRTGGGCAGESALRTYAWRVYGCAARSRRRVRSGERQSILLDEIGDMSLTLQQRLLRVLQEREVVRVGATRVTPVDVRVIASTHRDLGALVQQGRFREDLMYRLNVFPIAIPPLRERAEDIPFSSRMRWIACERAYRRHKGLHAPRSHCACCARYSWPGSVRVVFAALELAAIHARFARIETQHLPTAVREAAAGTARTALSRAEVRGRRTTPRSSRRCGAQRRCSVARRRAVRHGSHHLCGESQRLMASQIANDPLAQTRPPPTAWALPRS